jgi:hypothetical protein
VSGDGPGPRPRPYLSTAAAALTEAVSYLTAAMEAGEVDRNPVLGETHRLHVIQAEAFVRRELEEG